MLYHLQQHRNPVGASAAPLLMLPGTLCDARLYAPVLDRLAIGAIVAELQGFESAAEMARAILAEAPPRLSLCGFSLGAIVALEIVAQAPHRVDRLALIGCNPGALDETARAARAALTQADFATEVDCPLVHAMARDATSEAYRQQTLMTLNRSDSRPRLSRIDMPTLVMCGGQDRICPPAMSIATSDSIPHSRLVIVPGAGHYLPLERPQLVADELTAWRAMTVRTIAKEPA
jgi:pimeloyl-ACP methyl ester carboxylesterase